jgi:diguanylate cyclase (GGDEF)-like protein/PAS domain S-box-containing protein
MNGAATMRPEAGHPHVLAALGSVLLLAAAPLLWTISGATRRGPIDPALFLFWHSVVEMMCVVIAMLVFVTGYHAILSARSGAVALLGIAFLGVGLLDFMHAFSYAGMPAPFGANTQDKSMLLWLCARSLAALALLLYAVLPGTHALAANRKRAAVALLAGAVALLLYALLRWPERMPVLYLPGVGLSAAKIGWERAIVALLALTLAMLWRRRHELSHDRIGALAFAVALSAASELFLMQLGPDDQDAVSVLGHVYKVLAYLYLFGATVDLALRRPLHHLALQHEREKVSLAASPDGILWVSQEGRIVMANPAAGALSGYAEGELAGQEVAIFIQPDLRARHAAMLGAYFRMPAMRPMGAIDLELLRKDGTTLAVDISLGHWKDEHGQAHAIAYIRDLSERRKFEESLRHKATHDELTGLPNRWLFNLQLEQAIGRAARTGTGLAVMFLDLDYFKTINDSFGHDAGDALLRQAGERIRGALRGNDLLARLGGDEFAVLLADLAQAADAFGAAAKLLSTLHASYQLGGNEVYSGASLGLAFYPDDAEDSATLLRYADMAMYQAKRAGRGVYACYSGEMEQRVNENMRVHTRLKMAIAARMLELHYQPQVDIASGAVVGAEALLRWHDAVLGQVAPSLFIPVAEASGLMLPISEWMLDSACAQIAAWERMGMPLRVAVNFSAQQFNQPDLVQLVQAALARSGASAALLDIEITESVAMVHPEQAHAHIDALASLGCGVALDDFGTGYSSLAYLKALPVSKLKIDQSFVRDLPGVASAAAISRAIIALAHSLGMTLVAEGVETAEQLAFLREAGCEIYQGWLFAKAVSAPELTRLLAANARNSGLPWAGSNPLPCAGGGVD